jgi:hypothetical protein
MRHRSLAVLIAGTVSLPLSAQQVATVVVQPESLPGPQLVAHNDEAPVQLRGQRTAAGIQIEVAARDPQTCLRGVSATLAGGPALPVEAVAPSSWLPNLSIAAVGSGRSGRSALSVPSQGPPSGPPQNQGPPSGPPAQAAPAQSTSRRINLGLGIALGTALFDRLRERCESTLQVRLGVPADADIGRLLLDVQLAPRSAPASAAPASYRFGLRAAEGLLLGSAPPLQAASP